jgi:hypothetical protein
MPIWITALGVGGLGAVLGYVLMFILRRCLPPVTEHAPTPSELIILLTPLGLTSGTGWVVTSLDGITHVGPYGLGVLAGFVTNLVITWLQYRRHPSQ